MAFQSNLTTTDATQIPATKNEIDCNRASAGPESRKIVSMSSGNAPGIPATAADAPRAMQKKTRRSRIVKRIDNQNLSLRKKRLSLIG